MSAPRRLAILSTPRSGNTWLRHLLGGLYGLEHHAVHSPGDLPWSQMSERAVLQLHWPPTEDLCAQLASEGFLPVTIHRHPFDVLISILQFCVWEPQTASWLLGEGGNESGIVGAMPRSDAFREYVGSSRAAALLSVSAEWGPQPGVITVSYEDLVEDPAHALAPLLEGTGDRVVRPLADVVADHSLEGLRTQTQRPNHFWKGTPGHWRELLTQADAEALRAGIPAVPPYTDYSYEADPDLAGGEADRRWLAAVSPAIARAARQAVGLAPR